MPRLRRSDCSGPGLARRRRGRGFELLDEDGERVTDPDVRARVAELVIPPAWQEVWICPHANGHIQATGTDARGRRQYIYHPAWRERRDRAKFEAMVRFAEGLPDLRARVAADLVRPDFERERVLAAAVRLLERGFFRIGGEGYAEENDSYGLATLRRDHVSVSGDLIEFDYAAKSGQRRVARVIDPDVAPLIDELRRRRGGGDELLAFKRGRRWIDVRSQDINDYLKRVAGDEEFTAKVFRTWSATVLAAVALAVSGETALSKTARKRAKARACQEVARFLGNTPTIARSSYIDPRVFDRYDGGLTIKGILEGLLEEGAGEDELLIHGEVERGVLDLLERDVSSDAVERMPKAA